MLFLRINMARSETNDKPSPQERIAFISANICLYGYILLAMCVICGIETLEDTKEPELDILKHMMRVI